MLQVPPAIPGMREDEIDTPGAGDRPGCVRVQPRHHGRAAGSDRRRNCGRTPRRINRRSSPGCRWPAARSATACRRSPRRRCSPGAASPTSWSATRWSAPPSWRGLCALSRIAKVAVCADDAGQVAAIEAAAADAGIRMTVLVEIDVGAGRCGVQPGPDAVALATRIAASKHLIFGGLQAYHGSAQHKRTPGGAADADRRRGRCVPPHGGAVAPAGPGMRDRRRRRNRNVRDRVEVRHLHRDAGRQLCVHGRRLRAQPGRGRRAGQHLPPRAVRAVHRHEPGQTWRGGAGCRAQGGGGGFRPAHRVRQRPDIRYTSASDEHGKLQYGSETATPKLGEKLRLVPGHCDPTVDKFDWYVGVRNGRVECLWPVAARGGLS